jgi:hypothetical protein
MLNLFVRRMKLFLSLLPVFFFFFAMQDSTTVAITSPAAGDVLRGQVNIIGSTNAPDFVSAELDFAYASDIIPEGGSTGTWFPIQTLSQPVFDSPLYTWDTSSITDGDYILRLRVFVADGSFQEVTVPVKLQNDVIPVTPTLVPTATPDEETVLIPTPFLLAASPTPTDLPRPTPTLLPTNPVSLGSGTVLASLGRGALVILGLFVFAGLILRFRRF